MLTPMPTHIWRRPNRRLWASWAVVPSREGDRRPRVYFGGDSGYGPAFREVGTSLGPFDASILPIGAYEPRWFMEPSHMNPEEAVRAFRDLGARGAFVASHWGTFRLADEPPLEPPVRVRDAWRKEGLPETDLHVLRHGETAVLDAAGDAVAMQRALPQHGEHEQHETAAGRHLPRSRTPTLHDPYLHFVYI